MTGAGRRLGLAIAESLAGAGADLVLHCHASRAGAEELAARVRSRGGQARVVSADLRRPEAIQELAARIRQDPGRLDILVNSAADFARAPVESISVDDWDAMLALNLRAPFLLIRELLPLLRQGRSPAIVNVADLAGLQAWARHLHYAVSKAGLVAMTRALALELAPAVRVNAVAPGTILPTPAQGESELERIRRRTPAGRLATAEEVGAAVVFLADPPEALTGVILPVDGGRGLYPGE